MTGIEYRVLNNGVQKAHVLKDLGIAARLNALAGVVAIAVVALVGVGLAQLTGQLAHQRQLSALADARAAAQTTQFDFADFNGWQTAYSFDVTLQGVKAADDTAPSRGAFLKSVARTRTNLAVLQKAAAGVKDNALERDVTEASQGLDKFMELDDEIIRLYKTGVPADKAKADTLVLNDEIAIFTAAADRLAHFATALGDRQRKAVTDASASGRTGLWTEGVAGVGILAVVILLTWLLARSIIRPLAQLAEASDRLAVGDLEFDVDTTRGDEAGRALTAMDRMKSTLTGLIEQLRTMSAAHDRGDTDATIDAGAFQGGYREVAQGINDMVGGHMTLNAKAMAVVTAFGDGDFDASLERFPGKKAAVNDTIEQVRANLRALIRDTDLLVQAAVDGRLEVRADATAHAGGFRAIVEGINATLDAVIAPLTEVSRVLESIERGDLTQTISTPYKGRLEDLRSTTNNAVAKLAAVGSPGTELEFAL